MRLATNGKWYQFVGAWLILSAVWTIISTYTGLGGVFDADTMTRVFLGSILLFPDEVFRIERNQP